MSGVKNMKGSFVGTTGVAVDVRKVGYRPGAVRLYNKDGLCTMVWHDDMPDGSGYKAVTAGTQTFVTSGGITPLSDGFRLGTDADLNVTGEVVYYETTE